MPEVLVNTVDTKLLARMKFKGADYVSTVVPQVIDIFKASLEKLLAPVESPKDALARFKAEFDARTLSAFVEGFVIEQHVLAAGVSRKKLVGRISSSMARYALYVPFTFFAFRSYSSCSNRTLHRSREVGVSVYMCASFPAASWVSPRTRICTHLTV